MKLIKDLPKREQGILTDYINMVPVKEIKKKYSISGSTLHNLIHSTNTPLQSSMGYDRSEDNSTVSLKYFTLQEGTHNFDYILGILATDGGIYGSSVKLSFSQENLEILQHFQDFIHYKQPIHTAFNKVYNRNYYTLYFKNKRITDYLYTFGITPKKSLTLKLKYINWDVLRGIFDGDGCLQLNIENGKLYGQSLAISSGSINFITQLKEFYESYHLHPGVHIAGTCYVITISRLEEVHFIYTNIYKYPSYFLKRKYDKFCPVIEKFMTKYSVNSVKGEGNHKTEPSFIEEGAETRNGVPK